MRIFSPEDWAPLVEMLQPFKEALYVPVTGNAGDALIASGALRLFQMAGIQPKLSAPTAIGPGDDVLIAGGGNLVPQYSLCAKALRRCLDAGARRVLVLPHTVRGHEEVLGLLDERFTIMCRDHGSVRWVNQHAPRAKAIFAHDMALLLDPAAFAGKPLDITGRWKRHNRNPKYLRWQMRLLGVEIRDGTLSVFRGDDERTAHLPEQQDVSGFYISPFMIPGEPDDITADVFRLVRKARILHTNRLHIGIAGALSGLRVFLYDNSYGKISAIHDASLFRFPNVSFATSPPN